MNELNMNELKIKIKLPSMVTVHMPSFGDVDLVAVMEVLAKDGRQLILRVIKDRVLEEFQKKHEKLIGKAVKTLMAEKEEEIKKILEIN